MASEMAACAEFVYQTLSGDPVLKNLVTGVYADLAPLGTKRPYIVVSLASGGADVYSIGLERATSSPSVLAKVVGDGPVFSPIVPAVERVDTLLSGARVPWPSAAAPAVMLTCRRQNEIRFPEFTADIRYNHQGGIYAFVAQPVTTGE